MSQKPTGGDKKNECPGTNATKTTGSVSTSKPLAKVGNNAKQLLSKASGFVGRSPAIAQLGIGIASGWCTGFLTTRVGKTAAITVGGSVILIAVAGQTGLININWDRLGKKVTKATESVEQSVAKNAPKIASVGKYARTNTYFAAGFVGGFLIGLCS